jgi:Enoyl-(Acyl carrier protein) reductase
MLERNWGRVIFLSSESALNIPVDMIHYGVTNAANLAVARGVAKWAAGTGVTVNAVLPGPTLSEGVEAMLKDAAERAGQSTEDAAAAFLKEHRPSSIIRRAATVEEVANLVVYVASPQASATTSCPPGRRRRGRHDRLILGSLALAWYRLFAQKCPRQCRTGRNTGSGADLLRRGAPSRVRSVESWIIVVKRT